MSLDRMFYDKNLLILAFLLVTNLSYSKCCCDCVNTSDKPKMNSNIKNKLVGGEDNIKNTKTSLGIPDKTKIDSKYDDFIKFLFYIKNVASNKKHVLNNTSRTEELNDLGLIEKEIDNVMNELYSGKKINNEDLVKISKKIIDELNGIELDIEHIDIQNFDPDDLWKTKHILPPNHDKITELDFCRYINNDKIVGEQVERFKLYNDKVRDGYLFYLVKLESDFFTTEDKINYLNENSFLIPERLKRFSLKGYIESSKKSYLKAKYTFEEVCNDPDYFTDSYILFTDSTNINDNLTILKKKITINLDRLNDYNNVIWYYNDENDENNEDKLKKCKDFSEKLVGTENGFKGEDLTEFQMWYYEEFKNKGYAESENYILNGKPITFIIFFIRGYTELEFIDNDSSYVCVNESDFRTNKNKKFYVKYIYNGLTTSNYVKEDSK